MLKKILVLLMIMIVIFIIFVFNNESPEMAAVQAGRTSEDNGDLSLGYDIEMGKYEVTHAEFIEFLNSAGVSSEGIYEGKTLLNMDSINCAIEHNGDFHFAGSRYAESEDCPVIYVTWYGAVAYCNWLSEKNDLSPAYENWKLVNTNKSTIEGYRLPTENEWEYTARGGKTGLTTTFAGSNMIREVAWYWYISEKQTHPVGEKKANELGIHDMSGNVWEWTNTSSDSYRIWCGGSWSSGVEYCNLTLRQHYSTPHDNSSSMGFRVCKTK